MPTTSSRANSALIPARQRPDLPPLIDVKIIEAELLRGVIGGARVREALSHPSAPKPVLGGAKGSIAIYGRDAVIAFFERVARDGWPVAQGGA